MALVGPRPTVDTDYQRMTLRQQERALVRPGMTGLAQVSGGASLLWPDRIELDLQYIDRYRLSLDLWICAQTVGADLQRASRHQSCGGEMNGVKNP